MVLNFVFILVPILLSEKVSSNEENVNSNRSSISDIFYQTIDDVCSTIDECKLECCAMNKIYSIVKNDCFGTDIDMQLSKVKWSSVFTADHNLTCESICSENVNEETRMEAEDFNIFMDNVTSDLGYFCNHFFQVCYDYSSWGQHFEHLGQMDPIRRFWLPFLGMVLSILLLSLTFILYLAVPKLRRRIHDKCFLFHLGFRTAYIIMYLVVLFSPLEPDDVSCTFLAFLLQFSELSSVFWLNIICYQLWRCIKFGIPATQSSSYRMRYYSLYASGCSFLATILTISADWLPDELDSYKPYIGAERCMIKGYDEYIGTSMWLQPKFIYNYSIQIIIQIINFVGFLHIVYILKTKTGQVRCNQMQQLSFLTYVKLFLLMGLTTILDILQFHAGRSAIQKRFPIFVSASLLFVIFVCNDQVFRLTKERFSRRTCSQSRVQYSRTGTTALM